MIKLRLFLLIMVSFALLISCGKKEPSIGSTEIIINMGGEVSTIDPHLNTASAGSTYIHHAFEGLTRKDEDNNIVGGMAESWDISDDGLTYTFKIREDAKWSDGTPLTADDFVYSFRRVADPTTGARYSTFMEPIKNAKRITAGEMPLESLGVKALDDNTLEIVLENPTTYFLEFIATTGVYMPVREDIIMSSGDKWVLTPETYISNGPYTMTERVLDQKIVFEINTNYWAKDELVARKITVLMIDDANTALAGVKEGTIHFSSILPTADIEKLKEEGLIAANKAYGVTFWEINLTNKAFTDSRVRRALALAVDKNYIVENVLKGGQTPAGAFVPDMIKGYEDDFRKEGTDYVSVAKGDYQKNIEMAQALMIEAGYPNGEGYPVIEVMVTSGTRQLEAEAIQQMWKESLNIDLQIIVQDWSVMLQAFRNLSYELISSGWTGDYNDPTTMLYLYLSYAPNNPGYVSEEYDALMETAIKSADQKVRMDAMHKAEEILMNDMPILPLYYRTSSLLVSTNLKGYILDPLAKYRFHYSYLEGLAE